MGGRGYQLKLTTYDAVQCSIFEIPARNLDLNSIENFFHNVRCELFKQGKEQRIENEAHDEYAARMMETIIDILKDLSDRTIKSLPNHIKEIVDTKGDGSYYLLVISYLQVTFYFHFTCFDQLGD